MTKNKKKVVAKKKGGMSGGKILAAGAGVAALGAGAYYLLGPKAKAHQKKAATLMAKMKKEVSKEVNKAKEVTTPFYHQAVDMVSENYSKQYKDHEQEIKAFAKKMKGEWKGVEKKATKEINKISKKKKAAK